MVIVGTDCGFHTLSMDRCIYQLNLLSFHMVKHWGECQQADNPSLSLSQTINLGLPDKSRSKPSQQGSKKDRQDKIQGKLCWRNRKLQKKLKKKSDPTVLGCLPLGGLSLLELLM